ncbi:protein NLRC3-like, partial [Poecilia latipinna]|uniref:protein NLRC3-like n=1 Tax=Poecilia latipinna TaxID=48699 RepID=UPI00072E577D
MEKKEKKKKLLHVRSEFVKRVSEENLIQLLNDLETDGVFNLLEKRAKLEENQSTANKARETIDDVRKKGQKACRLMIKRLHQIDPTLSNELGLSSDSSAKEEKLFKVRIEFVERVSEEILCQLFDGLVSDDVFKHLEKEEILHKYKSRADKARNTIDAVEKKGKKACRLMIKRLHQIDPTLSNELGLSSDSSAKDFDVRCQQELKEHLKKKLQRLSEGVAEPGNQTFLNQIYTELHITEGLTREVNQEHEVRRIETATRKQETIRREEIFKPGRDQPIRTVMTKGAAGIGKTVLIQKFTLDWAEGKTHQNIQFIFPFTFRELNVLKEEKFSLVGLIHHFFTETKGISNFEQFQVLFIFDGLDESRLPLDFHNQEILTDATESSSLNVLLTNLIRGKLLPSALLWITTRPAAASQIPPHCVGMVTEVRGFNDPQKEEYFRKRFRDEQQASRI